MQIGRTDRGTAERDAEFDADQRADPDSRARTHLANERTFLAWLRTGLGLIVLGLAAAQFMEVDRTLVSGIRAVSDFAAVLIVAGTLIALIGCVRYFRGRDQIEVTRFQPAGRGIALATGLVVVVAALSLAVVYLLGR
ncbi:MAG: putative rane protein [Propionibacteriaceae bacterium]|jgi:putative membrane protein|nr:putative rane protein [Propionibacteriaceae bacterium]MDF3041497.1 putative rane protein [Thermomicrobiales bacterium]